MKCKKCKSRYAEYPSCDFYFEQDGVPGIYSRSKEAYQRRLDVFKSNEEGSCGCDKLEYMRERILNGKGYNVWL